MLSNGLIGVLQLAIAVSLGVGAVQTYRMWQHSVPYLPAQVQRVVPIAFLVGAAIALAAGLRSVARMRSIRQLPIETGEPGE
jgi:hypothetical protein